MIVLGNRPLDDCTPTVDMVQRASLLLVTKNSAKTRFDFDGWAHDRIGVRSQDDGAGCLIPWLSPKSANPEERSLTTSQNAAFTAPTVEHMHVKQVFLVSKRSHLEFALPEFRKYSVFKHVQPLESPGLYAQSIQEMVDYLKMYDDPEVRSRLEALRRSHTAWISRSLSVRSGQHFVVL